MEKQFLKKGLFGYTRESVCEYIAELENEYNYRIKKLQEEHSREISSYDERCRLLELQARNLEEEIEECKKRLMETEYENGDR